MTLRMQHIIRHLFKADSLDEVPRERLEALVEEYPSFSIARYLLSSKLRSEQADNFAEETHKTNLYFSNPFWLQWMLQQQTPVVARAIEAPVKSEEYVAEQVEPPIPEPAPAEFTAPEPQEEPIAAPYPEQYEHAVAEQPVEQRAAEIVEHSIAAYAHDNGQPVADPIVAQHSGPHTESVAEPVKTEEKPIEQPLVFESYHMIDYFASQGIKLAPDENPTDRLGKQMKSFTEWLKVMKRLPHKETGALSDAVAETKIQAIAAHSIEGREVVTETMAEVLAKQGMWEKASEVYRKLSLLDPGKSSYFASKIEQLKTN